MDQYRAKFSESFSLDRYWSIECSSLMWVPTNSRNRSGSLLRELRFSYCSGRGMPFREWNFEFREWNFEFRELLRECPGTLRELREWPFHSESVFPEIGVVPRLLINHLNFFHFIFLGDFKISSTSTERQKRSQNLAPVLVIISGNSLVLRPRCVSTSSGKKSASHYPGINCSPFGKSFLLIS